MSFKLPALRLNYEKDGFVYDQKLTKKYSPIIREILTDSLDRDMIKREKNIVQLYGCIMNDLFIECSSNQVYITKRITYRYIHPEEAQLYVDWMYLKYNEKYNFVAVKYKLSLNIKRMIADVVDMYIRNIEPKTRRYGDNKNENSEDDYEYEEEESTYSSENDKEQLKQICYDSKSTPVGNDPCKQICDDMKPDHQSQSAQKYDMLNFAVATLSAIKNMRDSWKQ